MSKEWTDRYAAVMMNTFGGPQAVLIRGAGPRVWDSTGKKYLDFLGGIAVNSLGHANPRLVQAVTEQLSTLGHVSNFFGSEPQIQLAEKLLELADNGQGRVFFTNSGTEAVECAFKLTRKTGRTKIVAAEGSFHGRTMGALALTSKAAYREPFEPLPGEVTFVPYGDVDALELAVDTKTAAILLEPIQGEAGVIVPPAGYLAEARRIASDRGALLWLDEVQTGMGRTGSWFAYQQEVGAGVRPDVVTVAKGLGGGIPIGACLAFAGAGDLLQPGNHGTTFGGNPVATAAALAVIDVIESDRLLARVTERGEQLAAGLEASPHVRAVTGAGLLRGVALDRAIASEVQKVALANGLIVNAPTDHRIRLAPPLIVTAADVDEAVGILVAAIEEVAS